MRLKKFDKILFWILLVLVSTAYGLYYWYSKESSIQSTSKLKSIFYSTKISDTITRIDSIYKDGCNTSFWITNYPGYHVVVDLCKYSKLRTVKAGNVIQKEKNSTKCTIISADGKQTRVDLQIEY